MSSTRTLIFTKDDIGCYADSAYGLGHLRTVLADLLEGIEGAQKHQRYLQANPSDDDYDPIDEFDALDFLNGVTQEGCTWIIDDVGLCLVEESELDV